MSSHVLSNDRLAVGIDVGGTKVCAAVVDESGQIRAARQQIVTPSSNSTSLTARLHDLVRELTVDHVVEAVGVGAAGVVRWPDGQLRWAANHDHRHLNLRNLLEERTGLRTFVDNDANTAAWAETTRPDCPRHLLFVTIGTGVGSGLILDGELWRGRGGLGAEIGHTMVRADGPACACGRVGCLEVVEWRVVNLVCSLGHQSDWARRRREVETATGRAGIENHIHPGPIPLSLGDDLPTAEREVARWLDGWISQTGAELVIGPHPQDGHHGHEVVARAIRESVRAAEHPVTWWMWGIWHDLPQPTMLVRCTHDLMARSTYMLQAHEGETERNDYLGMHRAMREVNAVRGIEQIFGYGSAQPPDVRWAELLTEVRWQDDRWVSRPARLVEAPEPTTDWRPAEERWTGAITGSLGPTRLEPECRRRRLIGRVTGNRAGKGSGWTATRVWT